MAFFSRIGLARDDVGGGTGGPPLANLHVWLDANVGTEEASSDPTEDGDAVLTWLDQSGNGYNFSSSGSTQRPLWRETSLNGLSGVEFDGSNDRMIRTTNALTAAPISMYSVISQASTTANGTIFCCVHSASTGEYISMWARGAETGDPAAIITRTNPGTNDEVFTSTAVTAGDHQISAIETSSTQRDVWLDGGGIGTSTTSVTPNSIDYMAIGSLHQATPTAFFDGILHELLVYDVAHDTTTRQAVETYLKTRWGTP